MCTRAYTCTERRVEDALSTHCRRQLPRVFQPALRIGSGLRRNLIGKLTGRREEKLENVELKSFSLY